MTTGYSYIPSAKLNPSSQNVNSQLLMAHTHNPDHVEYCSVSTVLTLQTTHVFTEYVANVGCLRRWQEIACG